MYLIPVKNGFHLVPESHIGVITTTENSVVILYNQSTGGGRHVIKNKNSTHKEGMVLDDQVFCIFKRGILESAVNSDPYVYTKCRNRSTKVRIDGEDVDAVGGAGNPARSNNSSGKRAY